MKNRLTSFLLLLSLLFVSCEKAAFKQFDDNFTDNRWMQNDVHHYDFELAESGTYDLFIDLSHIYGMPFAKIPVAVTVVMPEKNAATEHIELKLVDESGGAASDCTGDICDFEQLVFSKKQLEAGKYKISVANEFDHEYLPNIIGLGIRLKKSESGQ